MKDRLLDLLSREDEEESHGEDVVRVAFNLSLVNLLHRVLCVSGVGGFSVISLTLSCISNLAISQPVHTSMEKESRHANLSSQESEQQQGHINN